MNNTEQAAAQRLSALAEKGELVQTTHRPNPPGVIGFPTLDVGQFAGWRAQALAYLRNVFGVEHTYVTSFADSTDSGAYTSAAAAGVGILVAAKEDVEGGHLRSVTTRISSEVFSDFLDMARHLHQAGHKDPAAMLAGAVLEDGLRRLATARGITVTQGDEISSLTTKLADAGVFTRLIQKRVQVWKGVRNAADHARFDEYTSADVREMIVGVEVLLADHLV